MGNLDAKRDWGHAKDYVEAMWLMLQQEQPEDFVIATGITTSVRDFISMTFAYIGVEVEFIGTGVEEIARVITCSNPKYQLSIGKPVVAIDPSYFRPTEVELLIGDSSKAKTKLGWKPKYTLKSMIAEMMKSDIRYFEKTGGVQMEYAFD
jgi:GDPmannose 4,6-dehydratase